MASPAHDSPSEGSPGGASEPAPPPTDGSLTRRLKQGEQDAATALYYRYARRLYALAHRKTGVDLRTRLDPEDVVQSVFRTFFRRVADGSYDVPEGGELWGLLLVITINKIRRLAVYHRADKRSVDATCQASDRLLACLAARSDDEFAMQSVEQVAAEFVAELDPSHREIFELRIDGLEVSAIAERTQRSKRTVERVLQKLRQSLQSRIDE